MVSTSSSTPTQSPARLTISILTTTSTLLSLILLANGHPSPARPRLRPTVRRSESTTLLLSRPGLAISATASTMVAQRTPESSSSRSTPRLPSTPFQGGLPLVALSSTPRVSPVATLLRSTSLDTSTRRSSLNGALALSKLATHDERS